MKKKKVAEACEFHKAVSPNGDEGNVHLVSLVFLKKGRAKRERGEFLCGASYGRSLRHTTPVGKAEFALRPCPKCLQAAESFEIDVGSLWTDLPGPWVPLYTTSPARRDRPYARGGRVVGEYGGRPVRKLLVPADFLEADRRWCHRDQYHAWTEQDWLVATRSGRAVTA